MPGCPPDVLHLYENSYNPIISDIWQHLAFASFLNVSSLVAVKSFLVEYFKLCFSND